MAMIFDPKLVAIWAKEWRANIYKLLDDALNDAVPKYLSGKVSEPKRPKDMTPEELEALPVYMMPLPIGKCSVKKISPDDIYAFWDKDGTRWFIKWDGVNNRWSKSY